MLLYVKCHLAVMWLLVVCLSSHGAVGWSAVYDRGHTYFCDVCGDTELTKVARSAIFTPLCQIIKKPAQIASLSHIRCRV